MTETVQQQQTYDPSTHVVIHKHHLLWMIAGIAGVLIIGFIVLGGRVWPEKNGIAYTLPTLPPLHEMSKQSVTGSTSYATDPNGEPVEVKTVVRHPLQDAQALAQQAFDASKATQEQVKVAVKDLGEQLKQQIAALKQSAPQSAPVPGQSAQVVATAGQPQAAPVAQAPASGLNQAETNFFLPPGLHLNQGMGTPRNLAQMKTCRSPHRLEIDRASSKCLSAGYNDPNTNVPVRRCPNKCV